MKPRPSPPAWSPRARYSLFAVLVAVGLVLAGYGWTDDGDIVALATVNVLLMAAFAVGLWRRIPSSLPLLTMLPGLALSAPLTSLYFVFFHPEAKYVLSNGRVSCLSGGETLQLTFAVFFVAYTLGALAALGPRPAQSSRAIEPGSDPLSAFVEQGLILVGVAAVTAGWLAGILKVQGGVSLVSNAARNFLSFFVIFAGLRWTRLSRLLRWTVLGGLGLSAIINTIANARGLALLPPILVIFGIFLSSEIGGRSKAILVGSLVVLFPIYSVIGNQTRLALGTVGFDDFNSRTEALTRSLETGILHEEGGFLNDTMTRQFSTGGHALVVENWERISLDDFRPLEFLSVFGSAFLPAFLVGFEEHPYTGTSVLREYGFTINEKTSVEVSMVGSLFSYGGLATVLLGGLLMGFFHGALGRYLGQARGQQFSTWRVVGLLAVTYVTATAWNFDIIQHVRATVFILLYAGMAVGVVRLVSAVLHQAAGFAVPEPVRPRRERNAAKTRQTILRDP